MTQIEFDQLKDAIGDLTPEQMRLLRQTLDARLASVDRAGPFVLTAEELAEQQLQRRLFDAGLLSEIKPPRRLSVAMEEFEPIEIEGELLSETIIRERR